MLANHQSQVRKTLQPQLTVLPQLINPANTNTH